MVFNLYSNALCEKKYYVTLQAIQPCSVLYSIQS